MKKNVRILALVLCLCLCFGIGAQALEVPVYSDITGDYMYTIGSNDFHVNYNGKAVEFPDAQPFVDSNSRTLVPVRFVTEKMGADVTWDEKIETATIEKNGIEIEIEIGNEKLTVTENGKTKIVAMDTAAVLTNSRTYVPIRFVAEALGTWVGYSDLYNTAQIYDDVLTPDEIDRLHAYIDLEFEEHCAAIGSTTYDVTNESWLASYPQIAYFTGTGDFGFSNANEWALRKPIGSLSEDIKSYKAGTYTGRRTQKEFTFGVQERIEHANISIEEAKEMVATDFLELNARLKTDLSCVAASRHRSNGSIILRGILSLTVPENADLKAIETKYALTNVECGKSYDFDVEVAITCFGDEMWATTMDYLEVLSNEK